MLLTLPGAYNCLDLHLFVYLSQWTRQLSVFLYELYDVALIFCLVLKHFFVCRFGRYRCAMGVWSTCFYFLYKEQQLCIISGLCTSWRIPPKLRRFSLSLFFPTRSTSSSNEAFPHDRTEQSNFGFISLLKNLWKNRFAICCEALALCCTLPRRIATIHFRA